MQSVFLLCFEGGESCGGENIISVDIYVGGLLEVCGRVS